MIIVSVTGTCQQLDALSLRGAICRLTVVRVLWSTPTNDRGNPIHPYKLHAMLNPVITHYITTTTTIGTGVSNLSLLKYSIRTAWLQKCFWRSRNRYVGKTGVRRGSVMVPLDRTLASSYRLSVVTMSLYAAFWPQFATQIFGERVSTPVWWETGGSAIKALDRALVNVYSMLLVTILLIKFGRNAPCKFWG